MQNFEDLRVWQESRKLILTLYLNTTEFPTTEKYGLLQQMKRAAISIASNIAEGSGRISSKDKAHFYSMAYSSLMELRCQTIIASDLGFISNDTKTQFITDMEKIARQLSRLRASVIS